MRKRDIRALALLGEIIAGCPQQRSPYWLLPYRQQIRAILAAEPRAALTLFIRESRHPVGEPLAIWLRGLCGHSLGANVLMETAVEGSATVQLRTAQALQRMGAWAQLRLLAEHPAVQNAARHMHDTHSRPRDYGARLARYVMHTPRLPLPSSRRPQAFYFAPGTLTRLGKPAKPLWLIRLVLDRIHLWVHHRHSTDRWPSGFRGPT